MRADGDSYILPLNDLSSHVYIFEWMINVHDLVILEQFVNLHHYLTNESQMYAVTYEDEYVYSQRSSLHN